MTAGRVPASVEPRTALALVVVMMVPLFAGCNVKDWYNQEGYVQVDLVVDPGTNTSIDNFRSLRAAIYGVSLKQFDSAETKHFTYGDQPLIIDMVEKANKHEVVRLTEFRTNLRATERVAVRMVVFEAVDAAGNAMEICRLDTPPEKYPCFYQPTDALLLYDEKAFSPPRGGAITVGFPVSVAYATKGRAAEYFLFADPGLVDLQLHR